MRLVCKYRVLSLNPDASCIGERARYWPDGRLLAFLSMVYAPREVTRFAPTFNRGPPLERNSRKLRSTSPMILHRPFVFSFSFLAKKNLLVSQKYILYTLQFARHICNVSHKVKKFICHDANSNLITTMITNWTRFLKCGCHSMLIQKYLKIQQVETTNKVLLIVYFLPHMFISQKNTYRDLLSIAIKIKIIFRSFLK